jgi:RNA polymerase sigma factor (sigma-70 family)
MMDLSLYKEIGKTKNSEDLVLGNLRLVVHIAKQYQGMGIELDDLIHEGTIGLCQARDKYDPSKGKFSVHAANWIKATIRQALNEKSRTIRVPSYLAGKTEVHPTVTQLDSTYQGYEAASVERDINEADTAYKISMFLKKLKPKQQEIIKMKFGIGYEEEWDTVDIAKHVGLTVQAVNSNIRIAMNLMQK